MIAAGPSGLGPPPGGASGCRCRRAGRASPGPRSALVDPSLPSTPKPSPGGRGGGRSRFPAGILLAAALAFFAWTPGSSAAIVLPDFVSLVAEHGPTVVNISAARRSPPAFAPESESSPIPHLPEDSPYYEFFRRYYYGSPRNERFRTRSFGSGVIISSDGYIICNHHVIRDAEDIAVRLSDWREFEAEVVGVDERSDIGLLKIDAAGLPAARIGSGQDLQVGEWVLAIGSPFGLEHSVTAGIVSAKGRSLPSENYVPFIQTDVAINPGNSGGPLFNLAGEIVGINSHIISETGGFMGLSFAIPIEVAMDVADQLSTRGRVSRAWLGVLVDDVSPRLAEFLDMDRPRGAWIARVLPDGPAAAAGLREDDIVLEFDGNIVSRSSDLPPIVGRTPVGTRVPVKILRDGQARTLHVLTVELP